MGKPMGIREAVQVLVSGGQVAPGRSPRGPLGIRAWPASATQPGAGRWLTGSPEAGGASAAARPRCWRGFGPRPGPPAAAAAARRGPSAGLGREDILLHLLTDALEPQAPAQRLDLLEAIGHRAVDQGLPVAWFSIEHLGTIVRRHPVDDTVSKAFANLASVP